MSLKELLGRAQYASDGTEREIRFVATSVHNSSEAED